MASATDVLAACQTRWIAAGMVATYGSLYRDMKAYSRAKPYCILTVESVDRTARTCANEYWNHILRITVRDTTPELCETAINAIIACFDGQTLSISNGGQVRLQTESEGYGQEDEKVAFAFLRFSVLRAKARL